jgi:hypothetical protein
VKSSNIGVGSAIYILDCALQALMCIDACFTACSFSQICASMQFQAVLCLMELAVCILQALQHWQLPPILAPLSQVHRPRVRYPLAMVSQINLFYTLCAALQAVHLLYAGPLGCAAESLGVQLTHCSH